VLGFRFDRALEGLWQEVSRIDREIAEARPWQDISSGRLERARELLRDWVERLDALAHWLSPFLPETSGRVRLALAAPRIGRAEPLFPRLRGTGREDSLERAG
jgi:methionyl-tRNA synthetase